MTAQEFVQLHKGKEVRLKANVAKIFNLSSDWIGIVDSVHPSVNYIIILRDKVNNKKFIPFVVSDIETILSQSSTDLSKYPHKCPKCSSPCYIGFASIDCSNACSK